jgi:hypothetical protein
VMVTSDEFYLAQDLGMPKAGVLGTRVNPAGARLSDHKSIRRQ